MRIDGKVAIVTGAGAGIGAACARALAKAGAKVVVTDVDEANGSEVVRAIGAEGGTAMFLAQDVTDEARWPHVIAAAENTYGRLDIMVANAGIAIAGPLETMSLEDWQRQQAINLDGVFLSVRFAIAPMRKAGGGSIIIMSSIAGLRGSAGLAGYCATKGGVRYFAKAAALELAADRIRVNSVHPGVIDTGIWGKMTAGSPERRNAPIDPHERARNGAALRTIGLPQDIADGVLFLASDASHYMTGAEIVIDGGITAGQAPARA